MTAPRGRVLTRNGRPRIWLLALLVVVLAAGSTLAVGAVAGGFDRSGRVRIIGPCAGAILQPGAGRPGVVVGPKVCSTFAPRSLPVPGGASAPTRSLPANPGPSRGPVKPTGGAKPTMPARPAPPMKPTASPTASS